MLKVSYQSTTTPKYTLTQRLVAGKILQLLGVHRNKWRLTQESLVMLYQIFCLFSLGLYIFVSGFRRPYKRTGLHPKGLRNRMRQILSQVILQATHNEKTKYKTQKRLARGRNCGTSSHPMLLSQQRKVEQGYG